MKKLLTLMSLAWLVALAGCAEGDATYFNDVDVPWGDATGRGSGALVSSWYRYCEMAAELTVTCQPGEGQAAVTGHYNDYDDAISVLANYQGVDIINYPTREMLACLPDMQFVRMADDAEGGVVPSRASVVPTARHSFTYTRDELPAGWSPETAVADDALAWHVGAHTLAFVAVDGSGVEHLCALHFSPADDYIRYVAQQRAWYYHCALVADRLTVDGEPVGTVTARRPYVMDFEASVRTCFY